MPQNKVTYQDRPDFKYLASLGFSVCIVPRGEKKPAQGWKKYQEHSASDETIQAWQGRIANVAIITGQASGVIVLDVDSPAAQKLVDDLDLPKTPSVRTAKGRHLYFRHPSYRIGNRTKIKDVELNFRGDGGLVIGAGSQHPTGAMYEWDISPMDCPFAELPESLLKLLAKPNRQSPRSGTKRNSRFIEAGRYSAWFDRELQDGFTQIRKLEEGQRNDELFKVAVKLANHVAAIGIEWELVADELRTEALVIGLDVAEIDSTLASAWKSGRERPTAWLRIANGWIYVAGSNHFWSPATQQALDPSAFSMNFGDKFVFEKGTLAKYLTDEGLVEKVLSLEYEPSQPEGAFERAGERFYNCYRAPNIEAIKGDWKPFTEFLEHLVPNGLERDHLIKMMAWTIRNPGKKLSHALLLQSPIQGNGKTTLTQIWRHMLGWENTRETTSGEMDSQFQSYLKNKVFVVLDELNLGSGRNAYNRLKTILTSSTVAVDEKYEKAREMRNFTNWVFVSNLDAPILVEQQDRRFFVIQTHAPSRSPEYWSSFYEWWKGNLGILKSYFESIDLSDFEPKARPPMTVGKERLIEQSEPPLEQHLRELIQEMKHPLREVCTLSDVQRALRQSGINFDKPSKLKNALKAIGCRHLGQQRVSNGTRPSLWALKNCVYWLTASHEKRREAYEIGSPLQVLEEVA
ncbi:bifunctional DNA primase/polymerase [Pontixanthobacter aestiaquae]|uniref:DNA primase/polymerase bifunctional N-terminal domain-containing protein n=1 Tax=Pontixanthobacter aestiaquae TaxID=1509367 RepID=A0A844Z2P4_9SPHN|nr:bifunctional DNA primase/polymerase [Pontixanthobacter aestiaquae]MDN3646813.1 bifunctional DNA primase/polymerase [Pontixanthobacter aestiaquae]MXO82205.1 hypothetical protein [Pontixanthobacter aestiaquae]